tara:strand:- start:1096 stop:1539 length:444 start_codon:yes stop_codon:yes gene_type:complete
MKKNKIITVLALTVVALSATTVVAMEHKKSKMMDSNKEMMKESRIQQYSKEAFDKSMAEGKMIVLDFYKDGCPVCAKQHPILEKASNEYQAADFYKVNFKKNTQAVKEFKVGSQSTIIVFNEGKEVNRTVGETKSAKLMAQFAKAVM